MKEMSLKDRRKVFMHFFETKKEIHVFLTVKVHEYAELFADDECMSKLMYFSDILFA